MTDEEYTDTVKDFKKHLEVFIRKTPMCFFKERTIEHGSEINIRNQLILRKQVCIQKNNEDFEAKVLYSGSFQLSFTSIVLNLSPADAKDLYEIILEKNSTYTKESFSEETKNCLQEALKDANSYLTKENK